MMDFLVGEKVVHWNYGLGEILRMDVKDIHGREALCYVVKINDLTIWVPADDPASDTLRAPTPERDFGALFTILKGEGDPLPPDRFDRKAYLSQRMKDGNLVSICSVIRDLIFYRQLKKLNEYDKAILERAESFLLSEWMFSLAVPYVQARNELLEFVGA